MFSSFSLWAFRTSRRPSSASPAAGVFSPNLSWISSKNPLIWRCSCRMTAVGPASFIPVRSSNKGKRISSSHTMWRCSPTLNPAKKRSAPALSFGRALKYSWKMASSRSWSAPMKSFTFSVMPSPGPRVTPVVHGLLERLAGCGGLFQALAFELGFQGRPHGNSPRVAAFGVTVHAAAQLEHDFGAQQVDDLWDEAGLQAPGGNRENGFRIQPVLGQAMLYRVLPDFLLGDVLLHIQDLVLGRNHFPDVGADVVLVDAEEAHDLAHGEVRETMFRVPVEGPVEGAVGVDGEAQVRAVLAQGSDARPARGYHINHGVLAALARDELCPPKHFVRGRGGHVNQVTLLFAGFLLGLVPQLQRELDALLEGIEFLVAQVLVVLEQVQASRPDVVTDLRVLFRGHADLGLGHAEHERPLLDAENLPNPFDAELRAGKGLDYLGRPLHILQAQGRNGFHAEVVAGNRGQDLRHVAVLEVVHGVSDFNPAVLAGPEDLGRDLLDVLVLQAHDLGPGANRALGGTRAPGALLGLPPWHPHAEAHNHVGFSWFIGKVNEVFIAGQSAHLTRKTTE